MSTAARTDESQHRLGCGKIFAVSGMSPTPRRIATPNWLDLRLVLGVVLVLVAVVLGAVVFARADHRTPVVAADRDLAAGTVLRADDLTIVRAQLPTGSRAAYVARLTDALGHRLERPVAAGELLPAAALTTPRAHTTVTVPFAAQNAPELHAGQRIEIWVSSPSCAPVVVLPSVVVQDVHPDTGGTFTSGSGGQDVVVSVAPADADRLVQALSIDQAQIRAGILTGASTDPVAGSEASLAHCAAGSGR